ncbi:hypothetical protein [Clostridium taeniosporum]|uniref:Uncharacterized protein n=1 Tax=Clostridium taeniosporum TaxID=394958 RepID=A0A1D7XHL0_9CLOT|nr:hypothetical protein [Clostridium taeniosporum]AOR22827.1 hypothetical protein BGI42_03470 [Clostridium taeniosporum]
MSNKITLTYEEGKINIHINEKLVIEEKDLEKSFNRFKQIIRDNEVKKSVTWESILENIKRINNDNLEINNEYKTLTFGVMKYFYNTGKVFYTKDSKMTPLMGGADLFYFVVEMSTNGQIDNYEDFLEFCKEILESKSSYRVRESSLFVSNPGFNYGSAEYNFSSKKINKGASIKNCTFDEFKCYVLDIIK